MTDEDKPLETFADILGQNDPLGLNGFNVVVVVEVDIIYPTHISKKD